MKKIYFNVSQPMLQMNFWNELPNWLTWAKSEPKLAGTIFSTSDPILLIAHENY